MDAARHSRIWGYMSSFDNMRGATRHALPRCRMTLMHRVTRIEINDVGCGRQSQAFSRRANNRAEAYRSNDSYQRPYCLTALAYSRSLIERMRSGSFAKKFHAFQHRVTMSSYVSKMEIARQCARRYARLVIAKLSKPRLNKSGIVRVTKV